MPRQQQQTFWLVQFLHPTSKTLQLTRIASVFICCRHAGEEHRPMHDAQPAATLSLCARLTSTGALLAKDERLQLMVPLFLYFGVEQGERAHCLFRSRTRSCTLCSTCSRNRLCSCLTRFHRHALAAWGALVGYFALSLTHIHTHTLVDSHSRIHLYPHLDAPCSRHVWRVRESSGFSFIW
jgi:hypothetical protein